MKKTKVITISNFTSDKDEQIIGLDDAFLESISAGTDVPKININTHAENLPDQSHTEL